MARDVEMTPAIEAENICSSWYPWLRISIAQNIPRLKNPFQRIYSSYYPLLEILVAQIIHSSENGQLSYCELVK